MTPLLRSLVLSVICGIAAAPLHAVAPREFTVDFTTTLSDTVPRITLSWTQQLQGNITAQRIHRRLKGATTWVKLADLTLTQTSYADTTALAGVEYEYWMERPLSGYYWTSTAIGYISAGIKVPEVSSRGKLLLLVDDTMVAPLAPEISQLVDDLAADGWTVQQISAPRSGTPVSTKALVTDAYNADPANVKMLYLLGHVPVPYSGNLAPDAHVPDHQGAWPADGYYGDMTGTWTDTSVNTTSAGSTRNQNVPGDGKFDQSYFPSALALQVGRVDMNAMQKAPSYVVSESALLRRYLRKAHDFRYKQGAYAAIPRRMLMRDSLGIVSGSEALALNGWSPAFTVLPEPPAAPAIDEAPRDQWFSYATTNSYLMGCSDGGGSIEISDGLGTSLEFGRKPSRVVFTSTFGSYFGDWDFSNDLMRSILAGNADGTSLGLTCIWAGRPYYFLHPMGMGETIGYAVRLTQNSGLTGGGSYAPAGYMPNAVHVSLLGDPALRLLIVEPPRNLTATSANSQVQLAWTASTETRLQGYHVYRAATRAGPFTRLTATPQAGTTYTDATVTAGQSYAYMVRTLKLESVPGGSYYNLSHGSLATLTANAGATGVPLNPSNLAVTVAGALSWNDNSSNESGFRVERKTNAGGSYATLTTLAANAISFTDPGPITQGNVYYYRVIATSGAGDSLASNEATLEAVAGYVELSTTLAKVSRASGTAQLPVERFGGSIGAITVNYAVEDSSAVAGTHFTGASGTVSWAAGEAGIKNIPVPLINSGSPQQARQFRLSLNNPTGGAGLGQFSSMAVLIEDPTATLAGPWSQEILGTLSDSSPAVSAEGGIGSTIMGGANLSSAATSESGQSVYQPRTGDGMLSAFVPATNPVEYQARMAVMVRDSASNGGAVMAATVTSDSASGVGSSFIYRTAQNANSTVTGAATAQITPRWIRLARAGNTFTSQSSADGATWTTLGVANVTMAATAQWGLFHVSQMEGISGYFYGNYHQANFQNLSLAALPAPAAPGGFALTSQTATAVQLAWSAVDFAAGYRIERRDETGAFTQLADVQSGVTLGYTDSTVTAGAAYQYRMVAYNGTASSAWSAVLGAATPDGVNPLLRPGFLIVTPAGGNLSLAWSDNSSNETGFQIERQAVGGAWAPVQTVAANATGYADTSALAGVIYQYRVRAAGAAGTSAWAVATATSPATLHTSAAAITSAVWSADGVAFKHADASGDRALVPTGFTYSPPPGAWVTGQTLSPTTRNNSNSWYGMKFTVGAAAITVRELARWVIAGNSGNHDMKLVNASSNAVLGTVTVVTAGAPVGFKYAALATPVTLAANAAYYLVSKETTGGDLFYQYDTSVTTTSAATVTTAIGSVTGTSSFFTSGVVGSNGYGPLSLTYTPAPTPFVNGHSMTWLRNDFSGWLGMEITSGASPLTVGELGRWVVPGNSGSHSLKLVNAATGATLGSASVATAGSTSGQFKYAALSPAVTLAPNTVCYVLSQEAAGGDQWYDFNAAAPGSATAYQYWLLLNGLPMDASGSGSATASPASDGLPNLVKYALGLSPTVSGHGGRLGYGKTTVTGSTYLTLTYIQPDPAPSGTTCSVEAGSSLTAAGWSSAGLVETSNTVSGGLRTLTVRDSAPVTSGGKRFMRLKVSQP